jgi:hypothetical protein
VALDVKIKNQAQQIKALEKILGQQYNSKCGIPYCDGKGNKKTEMKNHRTESACPNIEFKEKIDEIIRLRQLQIDINQNFAEFSTSTPRIKKFKEDLIKSSESASNSYLKIIQDLKCQVNELKNKASIGVEEFIAKNKNLEIKIKSQEEECKSKDELIKDFKSQIDELSNQITLTYHLIFILIFLIF